MFGFKPRNPRFRVVVRSVRAATRPIRMPLKKADRLTIEWPMARCELSVRNPSPRFKLIDPFDRIEVTRGGVLISSLPIQVIRWDALEQELTLTAYERELP